MALDQTLALYRSAEGLIDYAEAMEPLPKGSIVLAVRCRDGRVIKTLQGGMEPRTDEALAALGA